MDKCSIKLSSFCLSVDIFNLEIKYLHLTKTAFKVEKIAPFSCPFSKFCNDFLTIKNIAQSKRIADKKQIEEKEKKILKIDEEKRRYRNSILFHKG